MSDRSREILLTTLSEDPDYREPHYDASDINISSHYQDAFYQSAKADLEDSLNTEHFKNTWLILQLDIKNQTLQLQRIFLEQILDKISDVYDFTFPINLDIDQEGLINDFYDFLEFLEYKNEDFITEVWRFLKPPDFLKLDISSFCKNNANRIIKEIDEQLEIHPQPKTIDLFLRTYYKDKIIEWFINRSIRYRINILVQLL